MTDEKKKAYQKEYRAANNKKYYEAHKTKVNANNKKYYEAHKTKVNAYNKFYQRQHYCHEEISKIENYNLAKADNFVNWDIHHRLETHTLDGIRRSVDITHKELKALGMYYNRPASELIFMTRSEHKKLHKTKKH